MTIYNRYGQAVDITEAKLIVVWMRHLGDCIECLLSRPHSRPPEGVIVEERPHWVVKATVQKTAWPVCDGLWFDANLLRAENGYGEIRRKLEELAAGDVVKYREWDDIKDRKNTRLNSSP